jgi:hypothetical protein
LGTAVASETTATFSETPRSVELLLSLYGTTFGHATRVDVDRCFRMRARIRLTGDVCPLGCIHDLSSADRRRYCDAGCVDRGLLLPAALLPA